MLMMMMMMKWMIIIIIIIITIKLVFDFFDRDLFFNIFDNIDDDNKTFCCINKNNLNDYHGFGPKRFYIANNHDNIIDEKTNDHNNNNNYYININNNAGSYDV